MLTHNIHRRGVLTVASILTTLLLLLIWHQSGDKAHSIQRAEAFSTSRSSQNELLDDVFNGTLGFQKIYVISLPSRSDQRDSMSLAAELSQLQIEHIDGVTEVSSLVFPPGNREGLKAGDLGAWRAHMNAVRRMIEEDVQSALVLEGDVDWDIRIKAQMRDFARASRLLLQPVSSSMKGKSTYLDPTYPFPEPDQGHEDFFIHNQNLTTMVPTTSPYGDLSNWDIFWLGHCGARFPDASDVNVPLGRAVILNDSTVPEKHHLDMQFGDGQLLDDYESHTRVVSRARMNTCSLAYALSASGARKMMYELGVKRLGGPMDMELRSLCHGSEGRKLGTCLSVLPQLFQHHRAAGNKAGWSDIGGHEGVNELAFTRNIRWSVRLNFDKLVDGKTDYIDQFRDEEPARELG